MAQSVLTPCGICMGGPGTNYCMQCQQYVCGICKAQHYLFSVCFHHIQFHVHFFSEDCSKARNNLLHIGHFMAVVLTSDTSHANGNLAFVTTKNKIFLSVLKPCEICMGGAGNSLLFTMSTMFLRNLQSTAYQEQSITKS
jgi:hypothetical protein